MKNIFDKINVIVLSCIILVFSITSVLVNDKGYSDKENRTLAQLPKFTAEKLFSGEYTLALGEYVADQFPLRDAFVGLKAYTELVQNKAENNGVIYTKQALIPRPSVSDERLSANIDSIDYFATQNNLSVVLAPIPRTADVFAEFLPSTYPLNKDYLLWEELYSNTNNKGFEFVDLYGSLCESNAYYRTDHHYTSDGAYIVYTLLSEKLGYTPLDKNSFSIERVADDFCGTSIRTSGFYMYENDSIDLYRYDGDAEYSVVADGKSINLYDFDKLNTTDKYAVFLGGNHARVDISKDGANRKKLLIVRDSFADSLVPFLAIHFDITLIDLRYYTDSVAQLAANEEITTVLVLENVEELATAKNLSYLRMK